jgi:RNA polymerase sigma factor (sigma-70 family)
MQVVIGSAMSRELRAQCSPEDIWQETLALAWRDRAQHEWRDAEAYRAWLFEIARNRIRETARRMKAQKRGAGQPVLRLADAATGSTSGCLGAQALDSTTPSRIVAHGEKQAAVAQVLSALPDDVREVVRLHLIEEQTMEAVARRLGIGVSAAWHRFRKGAAICARLLPGWTRDASTGR